MCYLPSRKEERRRKREWREREERGERRRKKEKERALFLRSQRHMYARIREERKERSKRVEERERDTCELFLYAASRKRHNNAMLLLSTVNSQRGRAELENVYAIAYWGNQNGLDFRGPVILP